MNFGKPEVPRFLMIVLFLKNPETVLPVYDFEDQFNSYGCFCKDLAPFFFSIQGAGLGGMKPNTIILGWPNAWRKREEESWRVFVDTIRNTAAAKMALLVPKGVQRYPDSGVSTIVFIILNFLLKVSFFGQCSDQ